MIGSMPISRGARCPIGKNWTNSISTSLAPARQASAYPSPPILAEALLRRYSRVSPPVAMIVALAAITTGAPEPQMQRHRAGHRAVDAHEIDDAQIAGLADCRRCD